MQSLSFLNPWIVQAGASALFSAAAYLLMRFSVANHLALRAGPAVAWRKNLEGFLLAVVWPVVATFPWVFAVCWEPTKRLLQSDSIFPLYLLAAHVAAAYPAYRHLYRTRLVELVRAGAEPVSFWPGQVPAAKGAACLHSSLAIAIAPELGERWRPLIVSLVEHVSLREYLPRSREIRVIARRAVALGTAVRDAHPVWRPEAVAGASPLPPFPYRDPMTPVPAGAVHIEVECIEGESGGMSSYYGYTGYFFSLLVLPEEGSVFDARGEKAA